MATSLSLLKAQDKDLVALLEEVELGMLVMADEAALSITLVTSMAHCLNLGLMEVQEGLDNIMVHKFCRVLPLVIFMSFNYRHLFVVAAIFF